MATRKCHNGHQYDSSIYGDNCPFCPSSDRTHVNETYDNETRRNSTGDWGTNGTIPLQDDAQDTGGRTVIRSVEGTAGTSTGGRRLAGIIVSYSSNPAGDVFKVYEGRNIIGRAHSCDICFNNDDKMSNAHLLILYREAENIFWAVDQNSSNGTYINGKFASDRVKLNSGDVIILGATKMVFIAIPTF